MMDSEVLRVCDGFASQELIERQSVLTQAILESAPVGVLIVDEDGRILLANSKIEDIFGYEREALLGEAVEKLIPELFRDRHVGHRAGYLAEPHERLMGINMDLAGRRQGGEEFPVEVGLSYVKAEDGIIVMAFVIDITQRKEIEEALRRHAEELERQNAELDAFAQTVAHDVKNPVSVIATYADIMRSGYVSMSEEKQQEITETLFQKSQKAIRIVDELLLLSSVRKKEDVDLVPLDMAEVVAEAVSRLANMIEQHGAEIEQPDDWPVAVGYGPWVEEVWVNYLSNGIKYGGEPPRLTLGGEKQVDGQIRFWVRDNGAGLLEEEQAKLFETFERLGQMRIEGHGLGLSIVRRIVDKLGGEVGVESEVGAGSTFYFTLPAPEDGTDGVA
ncbi:MAG TPA: PAS domain-containing sensor histidine kinase [Chloroflexi bacterium]|nr:PAS domain-containing sensor histidine kinase [Chloroflexota bacterium]